jgi:hypothetical protein
MEYDSGELDGTNSGELDGLDSGALDGIEVTMVEGLAFISIVGAVLTLGLPDTVGVDDGLAAALGDNEGLSEHP